MKTCDICEQQVESLTRYLDYLASETRYICKDCYSDIIDLRPHSKRE